MVVDRHIEPKLARASGIALCLPHQLTEQQRMDLELRFMSSVWPVLTPLAIDKGHPFPRLRDREISLAMTLDRVEHSAVQRPVTFIVVVIPNSLDRLVAVGPMVGQAATGDVPFILLEDLVAMHIGRAFCGFRVTGCGSFRVTRARCDTPFRAEEAKDCEKPVSRIMPGQKCGQAVRLELTKDTPSEIETFLRASLGLTPVDIYRVDGPLDLRDLHRRCGWSQPPAV